jgi:phosphoglycerol transferase MdoB-like AlkP superfamily enzyme
MQSQNFSNHRRFVPAFHFLLSIMLLIGIVLSGINIYRHLHFGGLLSAILIAFIFVCLFFFFWFTRTFPIKAQDRAIRAEESLRYFILSGKAIDPKLTIAQIAALRFASDGEFLVLADKAATESLSPDDIKKSITNWRADHHRV